MCATAVGRHGDAQVTHVGVERAVEDALLGGLAAEHDPRHAELAQEVLQRRLVERRVARLDDEARVLGRAQRLDELGVAALDAASTSCSEDEFQLP